MPTFITYSVEKPVAFITVFNERFGAHEILAHILRWNKTRITAEQSKSIAIMNLVNFLFSYPPPLKT